VVPKWGKVVPLCHRSSWVNRCNLNGEPCPYSGMLIMRGSAKVYLVNLSGVWWYRGGLGGDSWWRERYLGGDSVGLSIQ